MRTGGPERMVLCPRQEGRTRILDSDPYILMAVVIVDEGPCWVVE